ncbi:MAG: hybrid sensor histidine kinase/response regulator [Anaerolineae bacterium]|nr:hybrid sensor histidine kinase/response regulator [Anaerolineae bacterium]
MSLAAQVREQLINSFRAELNEHVQTINNGLLALEQGVAGEERKTVLENVFRAAHSLKGAARAMGVTMIEQLAHALESVLEGMQKSAFEPDAALFTACYRAVDAILTVQVSYEAGETTPPLQALQALSDLQQAHSRAISVVKAEQPETVAPKSEPEVVPAVSPLTTDETIRVSVGKLDALMAHLSELLVAKIRVEQRLSQLVRLQELVSVWQKEWLAVRSAYNRLLRYEASGALGVERLDPVEARSSTQPAEMAEEAGPVMMDGKIGRDVARLIDYLTTNQEHLRTANTLLANLSREYANDTAHLSLVIGELEQEVKRVRMLPLSTITGPFARMVRDLAQASDKEAVLQISGADTELDKRVLEQIKDPLIHLLRNAVDHGIEPPQRRVEAGKPRVGTITLAAEQMGQDVVICVSDDGRGLDLEAIREAIRRRGGNDVQSLSEEDLKEAIFNVGISTSPIITDISGRGVGLDVVRRNVEALHGRVEVDSQPGKGTTFTLIIPLTLTSSRGLLVRAEGETFAIPYSAIERITTIKPEEVISLEGRDAILYGDRPLPLVRLADVLELPRTDGAQDRSSLPVVILTAAERRMAFAVDELAGEQEVVIKSLGKQLSRVGGIAGATVMGSGEVVLILNVADLIKLGLRAGRPSAAGRAAPAVRKPEKPVRKKRILVVDDSITTRTLEKNILEAAGYIVELATDGQEALGNIAVSGVPDLIVTDVVMPRLDGFALTKRLREDPRTAKVPVILVTSLESPEDKARGIEVGADAYITKSSFDQNNLLETIEQLI